MTIIEREAELFRIIRQQEFHQGQFMQLNEIKAIKMQELKKAQQQELADKQKADQPVVKKQVKTKKKKRHR